MPLTKLKFNPGINREVTGYSNEGGWVDCDKIRFRFGFPEKLGGWEKYSQSQYLGTARNLHNWVALNGDNFLGIGTHLKYYIEEGGAFYEITPLRETTTAGDVTFSATDGDATITVSDTGHGAVLNDFVTFSGAVSLGGNVTAAILNAEHQITEIVDADSYTIELSVTANASDTGNGGSSVVGAYQINVGLDSMVGGTGWGAGPWSEDGWGDASETTTQTELRIWSSDNFGEDLIINPRDGGIYYWDRTGGLNSRAVEIGDLAGANETPIIAKQVLYSGGNGHVIAFGTNAEGTTTQDPLLIRFSNQGSVTEWSSTGTTTAGDLPIGSGSQFVQAVETKREILVWTDSSLNSLRYIGGDLIFGITPLANNITIMGPRAAVASEDIVFWMGIDNFYIYSGQTQQLQCTVKEKVFSDFNLDQKDKVFAGINSEFGEVWWFYPSIENSLENGGTGENDKYVVYNYLEQVWYYGTLSRTAWLDRGTKDFPISANTNGYLYNHEIGFDDDGTAIDSYIESAPIDIGDGDKFVYVRRLIPDLTFFGSTEASSPQATFTVKARNFPGASFDESESGNAVRTASTPVEKYTEQLHLRVRGRSFAFRVESEALGAKWKLGSPRIDLREDGRR